MTVSFVCMCVCESKQEGVRRFIAAPDGLRHPKPAPSWATSASFWWASHSFHVLLENGHMLSTALNAFSKGFTKTTL